MKKIRVNASKSYDILISKGLLDDIGGRLKSAVNAKKIMIVSDKTVWELYGGRAEKSLKAAGFSACNFVFPAGEKSKNLKTYGEILNALAISNFDRNDAILALGGGVTGDLAGFAAATYMRGISLIQAPTTLLSIIDSSVGGKTGIDLEAGKNLAGAFYQPDLVIADTETLKTLPEEEIRNGKGELVKYAILRGGELWNLVENGETPVDNERLLELCVTYKKDTVEGDERESGLRKLLNLGHTVGHAIEKLSGYGVSHGAAVAAGIAVIAKASLRLGLSETEHGKIIFVLKKHNLYSETGYTPKELAEAACNDKKSDGDYITLVTVAGIGDCRLTRIRRGELEEFLK